MTNKVVVDKVIELNNCAGRKDFVISAQSSSDELISAMFKMSTVYRLPHERLLLTSVSPGDVVEVVTDYGASEDLSVVGYYTDIISPVEDRLPLCRCGSLLFSDGFAEYCNNQQCSLTAFARIKRIANTRFKNRLFLYNQQHHLNLSHPTDLYTYAGDSHYESVPFDIILDKSFWNNHPNLEYILLTNMYGFISSSSFLVESLFVSLLESIGLCSPYGPDNYLRGYEFSRIRDFYGCMDEMVNRRNYEDKQQNHLMKAFMWSLGIESLSLDTIDRMMTVEMSTGWLDDPMIVYAHLLFNPHEMARQTGIHLIEANTITIECKRRLDEFFDIFSNYCQESSYHDLLKLMGG